MLQEITLLMNTNILKSSELQGSSGLRRGSRAAGVGLHYNWGGIINGGGMELAQPRAAGTPRGAYKQHGMSRPAGRRLLLHGT